MWVLRFNNGITSAGIAVQPEFADSVDLSEGANAWPRFLARFPSIREQFTDAEPVQPFIFSARLPYRSTAAAGDGWAMLPSAAAFVDPLFSTGFPLTLLGIQRLAKLLETGIDARQAQLAAYAETTLAEADHVAQYVAGCYKTFPSPEHFAALSMYYFAAASYSEIARRIGCQGLVTRFLAANNLPFTESLRRSLNTLDTHLESFVRQVRAGIEPLNVAGLCDSSKRNWYPVDLNDVILGAPKLGMSVDAMREIVSNAAWAQIPQDSTGVSVNS